MRTVTREEYDLFVRQLPRNAEWRPLETANRCIMQIVVNDKLAAQAHYIGAAGEPVLRTYQIAD